MPLASVHIAITVMLKLKRKNALFINITVPMAV